MLLKKVFFTVLLVLLAQIIVMKKLDRTKNKKQPSTGYRAYARKNKKSSSFIPTQVFHPKFHARAIPPEPVSKSTSDSGASSILRNKSTQKRRAISNKTSNMKRKRAIKTDSTAEMTSMLKSKIDSKNVSKEESTEKLHSGTKSGLLSTNILQATISTSSESKPIDTNSSSKLTTLISSTSSASSSLPTSLIFSSSSSSSISTIPTVSSTSSITSAPSLSSTSAVKLNSSSSSSHSSIIGEKENNTRTITSSEIIEETVTITVEAEDKNELAGTCYGKGKVRFSQYWIPIENHWDEDNDGERVYLGENKKIDLLDKDGNSLAIIPISMHRKCHMEGTCLLENGDIINIDNTTNSFIRVGVQGRENNVFGLGSGDQNLVPFISVASNDLPYGRTLYIKQLDGVDIGKDRIHNGCVRVDDDSWSFNGCQLDFFVPTYLDYLWLGLDLDRVDVKLDDCELKNYILKEDMEYIKATNKEEIIPSLMEAKYVKYTE